MHKFRAHRFSIRTEQTRNVVTSGLLAICLLPMMFAVLLNARQSNADCSISPQIDAYADSYGLPEMAELDDIAISGTRLYVYSRYFEEELVTFDISNPSNPVVLGISSIPGIYGAKAVGTNYFCLGNSNLRVYSMDDPNNPALIGTLDLPQSIISYQISGGFAFVSTLHSVVAVDISDPTNMVPVGTLSTSWGRTLTKPVAGILPGQGVGGVGILIDVSDPTNMSIIANLGGGSGTPRIVGGALVRMHNSNDEIKVWDISNPATPVALPSFPDPATAEEAESELWYFETSKNLLYGVARTDDWDLNSGTMYAIDFSNPASPVLADSYQPWVPDHHAKSVYYAEGLFACGYDGGFALMDVSSCISQPTIIDQPSGLIATEGDDPVTLTVNAEFATDYRWFRDGKPLTDSAIYSGADTATLTIVPNCEATGEYTVHVSSLDGSQDSDSALVAIRPGAPAAEGACCLPHGDCVVTSMAACDGFNGAFQGDDTTCESANCPTACLGDMNGDGLINSVDTQAFIAALLAGTTCP